MTGPRAGLDRVNEQTNMKKWAGLILVVVLAAAGWHYRDRWLPAADQDAGPAVPMVATAIQTNIQFAVQAAGEISPAEQVSVRPEINGRIELLPVDIGDEVRKGELLFKLDDKELRNQYESTKTMVDRARLELEKSRRDYERAQKLLAENLISQEMFDNARTTYELASNALERAQRELAVIEERLTKTEVRAPFDCTVLTRPVSVGQAVSGSGGFNSGTEVLTIADLNNLVINAHVNQADVPRLKVGQVVEVQVEAVSGLVVTGVVERIAPQATYRNNLKGFAARILLKNPDRRVRPGMTANVRIPVASAENVVAVPLAAVFTEKNPETGVRERFVYVKHGDRYQRRLVDVGVADNFFAEIRAGLQPGEQVALIQPPEELILKEEPPPATTTKAPASETSGEGASSSTAVSRPATAGRA
ncbi:MAG: efflux RND transporter periplasmic adaptor subunit [Verrucomicrobia bacterium]|nr:MAG: efflux RND transporter periplasmic adaptor subunit [Verrucomicrobiota bacterium]